MQVRIVIVVVMLVKVNGNSVPNPGKLVSEALVNRKSDDTTLPLMLLVVEVVLCDAS